MEINIERFRTDDILLASFLLVNKVELIEILEDQPQHFLFIFSDPEKCKDLKSEFSNNALVPARTLFSQREFLISEIKNRNRNFYGKK